MVTRARARRFVYKYRELSNVACRQFCIKDVHKKDCEKVLTCRNKLYYASSVDNYLGARLMLNAISYVAAGLAIIAILAGSFPLFLMSCAAGSVAAIVDYAGE